MAIPKIKNRVTDSIAVYEIVRRLSTPFEDTEAFEAGLIDKKGNFTKKRRDMSREERKIVTRFDIMIFNIKKLLARLPGNDSKLRNFATALFLLKEDVNNDLVTEEDIQYMAEELDSDTTKTLSYLEEEIATSLGGGAYSDTDAPVSKAAQAKYTRFGKCRVYEVDTNTFMKCRTQKSKNERFDKHLPEGPILSSVREYARKKPGKSIMISDSQTGAMTVLKMGSKVKW